MDLFFDQILAESSFIVSDPIDGGSGDEDTKQNENERSFLSDLLGAIRAILLFLRVFFMAQPILAAFLFVGLIIIFVIWWNTEN